MQYSSDVEAVKALQLKFAAIKQAIGRVIIGQEDVVNKLITSILCNGHSLLVGVPGLAKTLLVKTVADVLDLSFKRIQFTPDLMPSDITGAEILDENRQFRFIKGPIFANIILADEINRTPPKTQATQAVLSKVMSAEDIVQFQELIRRVPVPDNVLEYAVGLVHKTRPGAANTNEQTKQYIAYGAGPRASKYLILGAKCNALLSGKYSPDIEDVQAMALPVLRHRVIRNYKAEAEGISQESLIKQLL